MARKVLVADDSVTIQKVVGLTFANEDIELSFVDNGEEAITIAKRIKPDLIMADVLMPGKSGYEVCENVKADPELQHIPVLLLTGTFEPFDADRCAQVGANGTITKPFESQTLIREVRELLDRPVNGKAPAATHPAAPHASADAALGSPGVPVDPVPEVPADPVPQPAWPEEEVPAEPGPSWTRAQAPAEPGSAWTQPAAPEETAVPATEPPPEPPPALDEGVTDSLDQDLAFSREPDLALNREAMDAPQTPEEGAPASWRSAPSPDTPVEPPPAEQPPAAPGNEDVWDLSDFESVDESQIEPLPEDALVEESEALWNEAAAEAIDLVETTNLEADNEAAVETGAAPSPSQDASLAGATPEVTAPAGEGIDAPLSDHEMDSQIGSSQIEGESEFEAFDLGPDSQGESLEIDAPVLDEPEAVPEPVVDPVSAPAEAVPAGNEPQALVPEESTFEEVSIEAISEGPVDAPEAPAPESVAAGRTTPGVGDDLASLTGLPADKSAAIVSEAVKDAVEKFTWEAFGDLPETVVRAVQEKVEKIAWEVIPQMAETIIKEEIRRLKKEGK